jgi:acetyltransferase-like isoleucine patch superfamily enzyme
MTATDPSARDPAGDDNDDHSLGTQLKRAWRMEFSHLWWRLLACGLLAGLLPEGRATRLRTALIRGIGFRIGNGTRILGMPRIQSTRPGSRKDRLHIGAGCTIGAHSILEFGEKLTIGDRVTLARGVVILTTTHQLGPREQRAGPAVTHPVSIGNDVQVGTNVIILPGVVIGDGARVLPDSVVNASVAAGAFVSGIPARPVRQAQPGSI